MITAIIGHRGVGKTSFLTRLKSYYADWKIPCDVIDLDKAIEEHEGRDIKQLFELVGESVFREIEVNVFIKILLAAQNKTSTTYIALGAGFSGEIPPSIGIWWLRRPTDSAGRIFLDRPRIEKDLLPLEEYRMRFVERELRFQQIYQRQIIISEGWDSVNALEPHLFGLKPAQLNAAVTVTRELFAHPRRLQFAIEDMLCLGARYLELRDDLLTEQQIREVIARVPADKVLISFRAKNTSASLVALSGPYATDWAIELGESPLEHNTIVSLHERAGDESLEEAAERLLKYKAEHYKFAPQINNFVELWAGHRFLSDDFENRSFLPRSVDGRWCWYRQIQKNKMKLNFVRFGNGTSADQPSVFEYLRLPVCAEGFAAVLGDPVKHSRSPAEHNDFFREKNLGFVAIPFSEEECHSLNLSILERLGMKAAAVTSPLKIKIRELCAQLDQRATDLNSVNTMVWSAQGWIATNTDVVGLEVMFSTLNLPPETVVWGGGGTRWALRSLLKGAHFFSARKGEEIWIEKKLDEAETTLKPEVIVWALGRARWESSKKPPSDWKPQYIVDLNYSEDSPGIEMALLSGAKYISGQAMFKAQAKAQREFWRKELP